LTSTRLWIASIQRKEESNGSFAGSDWKTRPTKPPVRPTLLNSTNIFGLDGYFSLLIAQKVSYRKTYQASAGDLQVWNTIRAQYQAQALQGLTTEQAFAAIRSPAWRWHPDFYRKTWV